jgi:hypothetical protein
VPRPLPDPPPRPLTVCSVGGERVSIPKALRTIGQSVSFPTWRIPAAGPAAGSRVSLRGLQPRFTRLRVLRQLFDDFEEFRAVVAVLSAELDQLDRLGEHRPAVEGSADTNAASLAKFEESFVAEKSQGAQDGVGVDVHDGGEVAGGREPVAGFGFAFGDRAADLCGHLVVQERGVFAIDLDIQHCASHSSAFDARM